MPFNAYHNLFSIRKGEDKDLQSLVNRVDDAIHSIQDLRPATFTLELLDDELASMALICTLPDDYNSFVSSLLLQDSLKKSEVQNTFVREGMHRRRRQEESPSVSTAIAASTSTSTLPCGFCSDPTHCHDKCDAYKRGLYFTVHHLGSFVLVARANVGLNGIQSKLIALSAVSTRRGFVIFTRGVASTQDIDAVRGAFRGLFPDDKKRFSLELPSSTSFLKLTGCLRYKDPACTTPVTPHDVTVALMQSPLAQEINLSAPPRIVPESAQSGFMTAYFDIWDSVNGRHAAALINKSFIFFNLRVFIKPAAVRVSAPQCRNCFRWGHHKAACRASLAACCNGGKKSDPALKTPAGVACSHAPRCVNCKKDHIASSPQCPFSFIRHNVNARTEMKALYDKFNAGGNI
ncbi:hypothetical protein CPB83DRAFT_892988 [Crepidotus variabilis]|uniref:Gag-like protein n=1 Tax=Crepidotus variabilis TaxID=179855 RepID=A0A9P6EJ82_9AGAR|nr:hypothetical protein CPB83DRAFT_892988 [Crepidotus variabilis]